MGHRAAASRILVGRHSVWHAAAMLAVSVGLGGCSVPNWANPVAWYRDAAGLSKDDPKPDARNTKNLSAGSDEPYPNLGSVPPPPTNALSSADRERLRNSLAADRSNAKYLDSNDQYVATPPKAVPSPPLNAPEPQTTAAVQAAPVPAPPSPGSAPATEAPPQESPLVSPSVRSVPQGETPRPPPPPPAGVPTRAPTQQAQRPAAAAPEPPVPPQSAALPPPSAPPPSLPPALSGGMGVTLGEVTFVGNSARLTPEILAQLRDVAALRQQNGGGTIRVTGYSVPQGEQDTMGPQLASFNLALDRARAVAAALTQNGVPARAIEIGASPPPPGQAGGTVEVSLEQ